MKTALDKLKARILSLQSIDNVEKNALLEDIKGLEKKAVEENFMLTRLRKDKSIVVNILNSTITDLEKSKHKLENANQQLLIHQEILKEQKAIIELKSKKLSENLKKIQHSYNELEEFSHIASHDLKSPLRSISGFAYLLQKRYTGQLDEEADKFINFIISATQHMHEVIEALLKYSKVGNQSKKIEAINLNEVIKVVKNNLSKDIKENNAEIKHTSLPLIQGNKIGFIQLFQNLIANAIKYKSTEPPLIQIAYENKDNNWKFDIIDNGIGLDKSFQEKAFFPFQRLGEKDNLGMGLGLAICKKVVNLHDGKIYYNENIRGGTTFSFEIPN